MLSQPADLKDKIGFPVDLQQGTVTIETQPENKGHPDETLACHLAKNHVDVGKGKGKRSLQPRSSRSVMFDVTYDKPIKAKSTTRLYEELKIDELLETLPK